MRINKILLVVLLVFTTTSVAFAERFGGGGGGERDQDGNLGLLGGYQTTPNSSGVFGGSFNHIGRNGWGAGVQITWQPYTSGNLSFPIYQIDADVVYYIFGDSRGPYLGPIGGFVWTPTPIGTPYNVYGNFGGVAGWDIRFAEHASIGVEVEDVFAPIFSSLATNNFTVFAVLKLWKGRP